MLNVQQNILTEMQTIGRQMLALKNRLTVIVAMYQAENMSTLTDADIQVLPDFAHVTAQELTAAKNALEAINIAVGEYAAGTNATKLMRIVDQVPH
jgi:hypothetical protein